MDKNRQFWTRRSRHGPYKNRKSWTERLTEPWIQVFNMLSIISHVTCDIICEILQVSNSEKASSSYEIKGCDFCFDEKLLIPALEERKWIEVTEIARSETKPNNAMVETNKPGWDSNVGSTLRRVTACSFQIFPKIFERFQLNHKRKTAQKSEILRRRR